MRGARFATTALLLLGLVRLCPGAPVVGTLEPEQTSLVVDEASRITLVLTGQGVSIGRDVQVTGLPPESRLQASDFETLPVKRHKVGTRVDETHRFRARIRPLKPGPLRIAPRLHYTRVFRQSTPFGSQRVEVRESLQVAAVTLDVRALPTEGRPRPFSGSVGQFSLDATHLPSEVRVGDLLKVRMHVKGTGTLGSVESLRLSPAGDFRAYAPRLLTRTGDEAAVVEQTFVPLSTNATSLPSVSFSYFDPQADAYRTLKKGPFGVRISHRKAPTDAQSPTNAFVPGAHGDRTSAEPCPGPAAVTSTRAPLVWVATVMALSLLFPLLGGVRRASSWLIPALAATVVIALVVYHHHEHNARQANLRSTVAEEEARFAPATTALALFPIPAGASVELVSGYKTWARVRWENLSGWIPTNVLTRQEAPGE